MSVFIGEKNKRVELAERKDAINPNLFTGSKDFTGDWLHLNQAKKKDNYLDFTAIYDEWGWNGISQYIDVKAGETVTFSAYIKAKAGSSYYWYTSLNTDGEDGHKSTDTNQSDSTITATGDWQRGSVTFTATSDGTIKPRIERDDDTAPFWIAGMKLEKGPVATPWCPALEDFAWTSDITNLQNAVNNIDSTRTPIVAGASGDDLFSFKTNQIRLYDGNGKACKNLPPAAKTDYFTVQYIFETPNNDGIAIFRSPDNEIWTAGCNGGSYNYGWVRVANATDLTNLQNQIQANKTADKTDVTNLANRVTALENQKPIKADSQADAVTKSKSSSNEYYW